MLTTNYYNGIFYRPALAEHRGAEDDGGNGGSLRPGGARSTGRRGQPEYVATGAGWKRRKQWRRCLLFLDVDGVRSGVRSHGSMARRASRLRQRLFFTVLFSLNWQFWQKFAPDRKRSSFECQIIYFHVKCIVCFPSERLLISRDHQIFYSLVVMFVK